MVSRETPWALLPIATPDRVRQLLHRSLIKDPKQRLRDIGEARIAFGVAAIVCLTTAAVLYRAGHSADAARATAVTARCRLSPA